MHALCGASAVAHAFSGTAAMQELGEALRRSPSRFAIGIGMAGIAAPEARRRPKNRPNRRKVANRSRSRRRQPAPPPASLPEAATAPPKPAEPMGPPPPETWSAAEVEAGVARIAAAGCRACTYSTISSNRSGKAPAACPLRSGLRASKARARRTSLSSPARDLLQDDRGAAALVRRGGPAEG